MGIFETDFLRIAFAGALLSALSTALLSVFVALRKISFMSDALAHVSFAGVAISLLIGNAGFGIWAIGIVVLVALLIGYLSQRHKIDEANTATVFLSVSMAIAIILIRLNKNYTFDLAGYLFGDILLITPSDVTALAILLGINALFLFGFFKELYYMTYNSEVAAVCRIPVTLIHYLFLVVLAINIVLTVKVAGIVLVTAQLIIPGITALNLVRSVRKAVALACLFSVCGSVIGFLVADSLELPLGAAIVLILFSLFVISLLIKSFRKRQKKPA